MLPEVPSLDDYGRHAQYIFDLLYRAGQEEHPRRLIWDCLLDVARDLSTTSEWPMAQQTLRRCIQVSDDMSATDRGDADRVKGSAQVCLGATFLAQGDMVNAVAYYRRGEVTFRWVNENYGTAVALFALGLLHHVRGEWLEVFKFYEQSLKILDKVRNKSCRELRARVEEQRKKAIAQYKKSLAHSSPDSPPLEPDSRRGEENTSFVEFIHVYQNLAAGKKIWINPEEKAIGRLEVRQVHIDNQAYAVHSLRSDRNFLRVVHSLDYGVSKIEGNSMNRARIEDGDYILFQRPTAEPENGDIVAAAIKTQDQYQGTVKRYRQIDKTIILEPDSTEPVWTPQSYDPAQLEIIGIVVAVLKKL